MFLELRFASPKLEISSPAQARGWVSTTLPFLPPEFFNRDPRGRNLNSPSPFAVHCRAGAAVIEAAGDLAVPRLQAQTIAMQTAFLAAYPDGDFAMKVGRVSVETVKRLLPYAVHDFILENTHSRSGLQAQWQENTRMDLAPMAEKAFREALERRCALVGVELPEDAMLGDFSAKSVRPCKVGDCFLFTAEIRFRANLEFLGPWYFGRLANKGCGRLIRPGAGRSGGRGRA